MLLYCSGHYWCYINSHANRTHDRITLDQIIPGLKLVIKLEILIQKLRIKQTKEQHFLKLKFAGIFFKEIVNVYK